MLIEIRHRTAYRYATPASYAIQSLRLTPPAFDGQRIKSWSIAAPGLADGKPYLDCFGNTVHMAAIARLHDSIEIEASGIVETEDRIGIVHGLLDPAPLRVYLRETPRTVASRSIRELANAATRRESLETLHMLMAAVRQALPYEIGATTAHTSAAEALAEGKGVCQDHAHVFIAAARYLLIPARYVNGYFLAGTEAPSEAHHAWAEAWVAGLGWVGFDPANGSCPTERYVRLACGLDSASAAPIRGTQKGGENEALDVAVEVQQQMAQQ